MNNRDIETIFHITKLKLLEVAPLIPFLYDRDGINTIDVGGNTGIWCEAFLEVFGEKTQNYHVFEPMPGNIDRFDARLQNHLAKARDRVVLNQNCVGATEGEVEINYDKDVTTLASVLVKEINVGGRLVKNSNVMKVEQVTIDGYLTESGLEKVDILKIDVEGYEWDVLQGAQRSMEAGKIDNVYFEFGRHQEVLGQSFKQFFELFMDLGWKFYRQEVGRNYFGLNQISKYGRQFEDKSSMWMMLASKRGPSSAYRGPRVVGAIN